MASQGGLRWASAEDWEKHRAFITELYETRNTKLADVMRVMEDKHDFHATARMYKTRFSRWGLQKTLRFEQVGELLRQNTDRAAVGKQSVRLIRGKPVDEKRLKKYLRNLPADRHSQLVELVHGISPTSSSPSSSSSITSDAHAYAYDSPSQAAPATWALSCRTPSPGPSISWLFPLQTPEHLRLPEECMTSMRAYVNGSLSSGLWTLDPAVVVKAGPLFNLWNLARTGKKLLVEGQTKQAFQVLQRCFHEYKPLLESQSPSLFLYTYIVGLVFADGYPELYVAFLKYVSNLSRIIFPEFHPLCMLFSGLYQMGPVAAMDNIFALTKVYIQLCQLTPGSIAMLDVEGFLILQLGNNNMQSWAEVERTMRSLKARLEPHRHNDEMEAVWVDANDDLSVALLKQDRYNEAAEVLQDSLDSRILPKHPLLEASVYRNLFTIARSSGGSQDEAIRAGHRMLAFANGPHGLSVNAKITLLTEFSAYLREIGMNTTAEQLDENFDATMDELTKDIEAIDLGV